MRSVLYCLHFTDEKAITNVKKLAGGRGRILTQVVDSRAPHLKHLEQVVD